MKAKNMLLLSITAAALALFAQSDTFGRPEKAEFYPLQLDPHSSHGVFLHGQDPAENFYVVPQRLLGGSDIASASVLPGRPGSRLFSVEIVLSGAGRTKLAALIAIAGPDHEIGLVWDSRVYRVFRASQLDTSGPVVIADGLDQESALALRQALQ